jgi:gas vesicle protein
MTQSEQEQTFNTNMQEWMQSAMNLWKKMSTSQQGETFFSQPKTASFTGSQKTDQFFSSAMNMFQLAMSSLLEPDNLDTNFSKSDTISSASIEILKQVTESIMELQKQWIERFVRIGQETKAYSFDDMDKELFTTWKNIYEKEFQKYFQMPTIGLFRYYQERINTAVDKYNLFSEAMGEFLYMLYVPFEKSTQIYQKELENKMSQGEFNNNFKEHYNQWIRILEGHFMSLLKSKEYTEVLNQAIQTYVHFKKAKDDVLIDLLQQVPVPTNKEMDELYKDIYDLKQTVKSLNKTIRSLTSTE